MISQHTTFSSLRHPDIYRKQYAQSQRCNQILPKSLPARPAPTRGQKDIAAECKNIL